MPDTTLRVDGDPYISVIRCKVFSPASTFALRYTLTMLPQCGAIKYTTASKQSTTEQPVIL